MNAKVSEAVEASETLIRAIGKVSTAKLGAASLALALGRVCGAAGIDLEAAIVLAKVARREANLLGYLEKCAVSPLLREECPS